MTDQVKEVLCRMLSCTEVPKEITEEYERVKLWSDRVNGGIWPNSLIAVFVAWVFHKNDPLRDMSQDVKRRESPTVSEDAQGNYPDGAEVNVSWGNRPSRFGVVTGYTPDGRCKVEFMKPDGGTYVNVFDPSRVTPATAKQEKTNGHEANDLLPVS